MHTLRPYFTELRDRCHNMTLVAKHSQLSKKWFHYYSAL